jgi:hypothetical protein
MADRFCGKVNYWAPQFIEVVDLNAEASGSGLPEVNILQAHSKLVLSHPSCADIKLQYKHQVLASLR